MLPASSDRILQTLKATDKVLDIGGWAHPFNRANYVMDAEPFETRGYYNRTFAKHHPIPPIGGNVEFFDRAGWIQRDICAKEPFPFETAELDYVICSHVLEDIRDPLWVCSEMMRIAKAGYIEVPSRLVESCRGFEPGIAGLSHHRWLIEIEGSAIRFLQKLHLVHNRRYSFPKSIARQLSDAERVACLFWNTRFNFREVLLHGEAQANELKRFIDSVRPYSPVMTRLEDLSRNARNRLDGALSKFHKQTA